ncbi:MAG: FeoC-like transcriptional regulator [Lachnospiraceae bacterium]|nr:FeoC-like transcriptional regulator [Lachnospiraceae bacterium]MDD7176871.1 FeoC-like transcriptional regulator [bacterium]MDY5517592.1 FeoC-like transcriptional regulator [Lachnospiraceae bacterium]
MNHKDQYSNYKSCSMCGRLMPIDYEKDFCPACEDDVLFKEVREYIRSHDVTEFELAEIFNISQSKVRKWIKEGRIEYVTAENKMVNTRCQRCGVPITFGTLCSDCMRVMNGSKEMSFISAGKKQDRNRMRFLMDGEDE